MTAVALRLYRSHIGTAYQGSDDNVSKKTHMKAEHITAAMNHLQKEMELIAT